MSVVRNVILIVADKNRAVSIVEISFNSEVKKGSEDNQRFHFNSRDVK